MDFMKVFDQTVREIKREVNLKVLKVPEIEQKVLDATDNEPWGPHGSAMAEIAQATKKFTECQMVMNVLWTRLRETGKDWRYVYKALAVIEYLVAHGSERAVDDIIEHTFQISSLSSFEYVEPSGKDMGINVRKKAETIVNLLNDKDKIQEVRNKAAGNRDKYFGLSSSGASYKSSAVAFGSSSYDSSDHYKGSSYDSSDHYKGRSGSREGDSFSSSYQSRDQYEDKDTHRKSSGVKYENQGSSVKKTSTRINSKDQDGKSASTVKLSAKMNSSDNYKPSSSAPSSNDEDDFDDFDPRGTSTTKSAADSSNQVDLFGESLIGDLLDAPVSDSAPAVPASNSSSADVDLFADADFVSAPPAANSQNQNEVDLFAPKHTGSIAVTKTVDLFGSPDPVIQQPTKPIEPVPANPAIIDPFAALPLNTFDGSDPFGDFTSNSNSDSTSISTGPSQSRTDASILGDLDVKTSTATNLAPKKDTFQVKSGIWADSLSRGLIDLNITAPKKVSLAEVGIVGGLTDSSDEREKGPPTTLYMGRAMGSGSGLGKSSFTSSQSAGVDDFFSSFTTQSYQFNPSKK